MNKPIKYRAWHKVERKMYHWGSGVIAIDHQLNVHTVPDGRILRHEDVELDEFTTMFDKADKEIYDSDILQLSEDVFSVAMEPQLLYTRTERYKVYWSDDRWGLQDSKGGDYDNGDYYQGYDINNWNEFEVIGNVYESPDLLSKEQ